MVVVIIIGVIIAAVAITILVFIIRGIIRALRDRQERLEWREVRRQALTIVMDRVPNQMDKYGSYEKCPKAIKNNLDIKEIGFDSFTRDRVNKAIQNDPTNTDTDLLFAEEIIRDRTKGYRHHIFNAIKGENNIDIDRNGDWQIVDRSQEEQINNFVEEYAAWLLRIKDEYGQAYCDWAYDLMLYRLEKSKGN